MAEGRSRLIERLEAVLDDPDVRPATIVAAVKQLAELGATEPAPTEVAADDPAGAMRAIVARYCPEHEELENVDPDPMRDLDFMRMTIARGLPAGRAADPLLWTWCPYCPGEPVKAERAIVSAARRLGVGEGPYRWPPESAGDELANRRRRRAG